MRNRLAPLFAAALLAICAPRAHAFSSVGEGAHHGAITLEAAQAKGFPDSTANRLSWQAQAPDVRDNSYDIFTGKTSVDKKKYAALHHFDRNVGVTDAAAYQGGAGYVRATLRSTIARIQAGTNAAAYDSLGNCLHALEDCFSHSNFVDLAAADQAKVTAAFYDSTVVLPPALWMTGYDADVADDESPPNDPHPHKTLAKDWATKNAESQLQIGGVTKFKLARDAAEAQVEVLLDKVKAAVTAAQWDAFLGVPAEPDPQVSEDEWECAEEAPTTASTFGCFDAAIGGPDLQLTLPDGALASPDSVRLIGLPARAFLTNDMLDAADGARIVPGWDIRIGEFESGDAFGRVCSAVAALPDSAVDANPGDLWNVYAMDQAAEAWVPVAGATVDVGARTARFPVAHEGIYALGHVPGATPVLAVTADAEAASADAIVVRWAPSGDALGYRVLRADAASGPFDVLAELTRTDADRAADTWRDGSVAPATRYFYEVAALVRGAWNASSPVSAATPAMAFALGAPAPNPSVGGARIDFALPNAGDVSLALVDVRGRVVRMLARGSLAGGAHTVAWDGRAAGGSRVAPGAYFVRLAFGGRVRVERLVVAAN